jgi:hypothetical protein
MNRRPGRAHEHRDFGLVDAERAGGRRMRHIGDFRKWKEHDEYQKAFERLMRDLKAGEKEPG